MQINEELLLKLENLSALKIPSEKREQLMKQFSEFVDFIDILDSANIQEVISDLNKATPFREDRVLNSDVINSVLTHSPKHKDNFFIVPKIIE